MRSARRHVRIPEMTSLLDVCFIVTFAALIQARSDAHAEKEPPAPVAVVVADAGVPDAPPAPPAPPDAAPPSPDSVDVRDRIRGSARGVLDSIVTGDVVHVGITEPGRIVTLRRRGGPAKDVDIPIVTAVPNDARVPYRYLPGVICEALARELGVSDLRRSAIVVTADRPMRETSSGLIEGLQSDECVNKVNGFVLIVDALREERP